MRLGILRGSQLTAFSVCVCIWTSDDKCDIGGDPAAVNNFLKYLKIVVNKSLRSWDHRNPSRLPGIPADCASPFRA